MRACSTDTNAPDEALCHAFLDEAVLENGVNLVDTAEQYPIPSGLGSPEGKTEQIIGKWMSKVVTAFLRGTFRDQGRSCACHLNTPNMLLLQGDNRREKLVIATKITGGDNVTPRNIVKDCEGSLRRLGTDYIDLYMLHWPARYTPQVAAGRHSVLTLILPWALFRKCAEPG